MSTPLPSAVRTLLLEFSFAFTAPTFENFTGLVVGWVLCVGRHTVTGAIRAGCLKSGKDHSVFYRFFSLARWEVDQLGRAVFGLVLPFLSDGMIYAIVDDTLCHRGGPQIWGGTMHHDAGKSSYARSATGKRSVTLSFGHNWVVLSVWVPVPWNAERGVAIPVLWRLYRAKSRCPPETYKKRTEFAVELITLLVSWLPPDRRVEFLGDGEYACKTVVRNLPDRVDFVGPAVMDAALFEPAGKYRGTGRPRKKGRRLPSPRQLANDGRRRWKLVRLKLYGREVSLKIKTLRCLWYTVAGTRLVTVVVTRDPRGRLADRAFFSTNADHSVGDIVQAFCRRWSLEVTFRDAKQFLGAEDPQNGWWRRSSGKRRPPQKAGPEPHKTRGQKAASRTAPFAFIVYAIVTIWYFKNGTPEADVERVRLESKWYRHKTEPSFADMLAAMRRDLWTARLSEGASGGGLSPKVLAAALPDWLLRAS